MRYANSAELSQFHDSFLAMCEKHTTTKDEWGWGFPGGIIDCDTYSFNTDHGLMYIGHSDEVADNRWWIPIGLESQAYGSELAIAYEMNIPFTENRHISLHYTFDNDNRIHILHKGKVTVGHGSIGMDEFFRYYRNNPGRWPVINFSGYEYLELGKVSLPITDDEFLGLLESLAEFANYIQRFKNNWR